MLASSIRTNQQYGGLVEACGDRPGDRDVPGDGVPRRKLPLLRIPLPRLGRCILNPWGFLANLIWSAAIYAIALWARLPPQRVQEQITETAIETAEKAQLERAQAPVSGQALGVAGVVLSKTVNVPGVVQRTVVGENRS